MAPEAPEQDEALPLQLAIRNPMGAIGVGAQALAAVLFIFAVIARIPHNLTVAFEGQNVGRRTSPHPASQPGRLLRVLLHGVEKDSFGA